MEVIAAILACRADNYAAAERGWLSFTLPRMRAEKAIEENKSLWDDVKLIETDWGGKYTLIDGEEFYCAYYGWD